MDAEAAVMAYRFEGFTLDIARGLLLAVEP